MRCCSPPAGSALRLSLDRLLKVLRLFAKSPCESGKIQNLKNLPFASGLLATSLTKRGEIGLIYEVRAGPRVIEFRLEKADASVVRRSWMLIHSILTPWTRHSFTRPSSQELLANRLLTFWELMKVADWSRNLPDSPNYLALIGD